MCNLSTKRIMYVYVKIGCSKDLKQANISLLCQVGISAGSERLQNLPNSPSLPAFLVCKIHTAARY